MTAYRDREHLYSFAGPVYYLPNVDSRERAVRALLRWWWRVECRTKEGANPCALSPGDESAAFLRQLVV